MADDSGALNDRVQRLRAQRLWANKPAKPLIDGDQLVFHYALRCKCQHCGRLVSWDFDEGSSRLTTVCCNTRYSLVPRTVVVSAVPVEPNPLLPSMDGSNYSDPRTDLSDRSVGGGDLAGEVVDPLSPSQRDLRLGGGS